MFWKKNYPDDVNNVLHSPMNKSCTTLLTIKGLGMSKWKHLYEKQLWYKTCGVMAYKLTESNVIHTSIASRSENPILTG